MAEIVQQKQETIIWRWSYRNPKTGETVYPKKGKPFPIKIKAN